MKKKFVYLMTWLCAAVAVCMMRVSAAAPLLTVTAPMTGDKGFKKYILWIVIAVILLIAFVALGILQKKRRNSDDNSQS